MFLTYGPAARRRSAWMACGLMIGLLSAAPASAQQAPATTAPPAQAPATSAAPPAQAAPVSNARLFPNDGGMVLNFIKPDKVADFEEVMAKLKEALAKSDKPERKEQARGWKIFKSPDPAGANVLFVFLIDPSVKTADYQISNIIAESFPGAEANVILKKYVDAYAQGMNIINLSLVQKLGE
jgi:hypothetical protein